MFKSTKIHTLITVALALLATLLTGVGISGLLGIRTANDAHGDTYQNIPTLIAIARQQQQLVNARLVLVDAAADPSKTEANAALLAVESLIEDSDKQWKIYRDFPAEDDEKRLAATVESARSTLKASAIAPMIAALRSQDKASAIHLAFDVMPDRYREFAQASAKLEDYQVQNSAQSYASGVAAEHLTMGITAGAIVIGLLTALSTWFVLRGAISKPLRVALDQLERIEAGDLTCEVEIERDDELGVLLRGLRKMQEALSATVQTIRAGVEAIASAASEIAAGNTNLSQRTEEQAASLEETASSMEELTAAVKQNAENAAHGRQLADEVANTAQSGATVVRRVVTTMSRINESATQMAEIINAIEGIAFQTNILALNAAVEAARAGEGGRGFAVVASEVRSLAQRSASAAKEIKELINASATRVKEGAVQADEAGQQMEQMLSAVNRVTGLIGEIAAASGEQAKGIEQVNTAVTQMDEVTQQNAALVEEAAAAAASMDEQATKMRDVVAVFRTDVLRQSASTRGAGRHQLNVMPA